MLLKIQSDDLTADRRAQLLQLPLLTFASGATLSLPLHHQRCFRHAIKVPSSCRVRCTTFSSNSIIGSIPLVVWALQLIRLLLNVLTDLSDQQALFVELILCQLIVSDLQIVMR